MPDTVEIYDDSAPYDDAATTYDGYAIGNPAPETDVGAAGAPTAEFDGIGLFYMDFALPCQVAYASGAVVNFFGILDTAGADPFGEPAVTTHRLRYANGPSLRAGDRVTIDGATFTVVDPPRRLSGLESLADLVRQQ